MTSPEAKDSAARQREHLLRFFSHDVRTPIAAIITLARKLPPGHLQEQARVLLDMVDDFGCLLTCDADQLQLRAELMSTLVEEAVHQVQPYARNKGQRITTDTQADAFVQADSRLLVRVLGQTLRAALHQAPAGVAIAVQTAVDEQLTLCVRTPLDSSPTAAKEFAWMHDLQAQVWEAHQAQVLPLATEADKDGQSRHSGHSAWTVLRIQFPIAHTH